MSTYSFTNDSIGNRSQIGGVISQQNKINVFVDENNLFTLGKKHQALNKTSKFKVGGKSHISPNNQTAIGQQRKHLNNFDKKGSALLNTFQTDGNQSPINFPNESKHEVFSGGDDSYIYGQERGAREITQHDLSSIDNRTPQTPYLQQSITAVLTSDKLTFRDAPKKKPSLPYHQSTTQ